MKQTKRSTNNRVGMYLAVETRNRLNRFIAEQRIETNSFISQSAAIEMLLDHYKDTTANKRTERVREFA